MQKQPYKSSFWFPNMLPSKSLLTNYEVGSFPFRAINAVLGYLFEYIFRPSYYNDVKFEYKEELRKFGHQLLIGSGIEGVVDPEQWTPQIVSTYPISKSFQSYQENPDFLKDYQNFINKY